MQSFFETVFSILCALVIMYLAYRAFRPIKFRNMQNGYIESSSFPFLWALLFGPFYWIFKGIWRHALLHILIVPWVIYPFFARGIVKRHYLRMGWEETEPSVDVVLKKILEITRNRRNK